MRRFLINAGAVAGGLTIALLGMLRDLFASIEPDKPDIAEDRQLIDTDLIGEYNHRTGRLDAGNDPYGWYEED